MLLSSAKKTGIAFLFMTAGKSFMYKTTSVGPSTKPYGTPCLMAKHATLLILDCAAQFLQCVATYNCTDCGALRQEVHKQNAFSVPKQCAHDLPSGSGLPQFQLCWG